MLIEVKFGIGDKVRITAPQFLNEEGTVEAIRVSAAGDEYVVRGTNGARWSNIPEYDLDPVEGDDVD